MRYSNQGQITIYVCAMLSVFLILILTVLQGICIWEGGAKCSQSTAGAVSSLKGDYQPDLFRRYHLLALDRTYYGRGEGYMEERAKEYLEYNLNPEHSLHHYQIEDVILSDSVSLLENDLKGMRQQIEDYMTLRFPLQVLQEFSEKMKKTDSEQQKDRLEQELENLPDVNENNNFSYADIGGITREDIQALGLEEDLLAEGITDFDNLTVEDLLQTDCVSQGKLTDPREDYNAVQSSDILTAIIPEQSGAISREQRNLQNMPSAVMEQQDDNWDFFSADFTGLDFTNLNFADLNFDSLNSFDLDTTDTGKLYEVAYILDNFQYYGHALNSEEDEDYHAMECEIEYILAGKASDYENLSKIAEELMVIRFVPNASYAFTNETMKKEALLAATLLLAPLHLEEAAKPVSYILLACWAYGESLADVRGLLQGKCIPFTKDSSNWQLSLNGIKNLAQQEISDCDEEEGMTYQDYLIILCLMSNQQMQDYRMLDIMEWNLQKDIPGFKIENCICEFMLQTRIRENERVWYFEQTGSYLNRE